MRPRSPSSTAAWILSIAFRAVLLFAPAFPAQAVTLLELTQRADAKDCLYYADESQELFVVVRKVGSRSGRSDRLGDEIHAGTKDAMEPLKIAGFWWSGVDEADDHVDAVAQEGDTYFFADGGQLLESSLPPFTSFLKNQHSKRVRIERYYLEGILQWALDL